MRHSIWQVISAIVCLVSRTWAGLVSRPHPLSLAREGSGVIFWPCDITALMSGMPIRFIPSDLSYNSAQTWYHRSGNFVLGNFCMLNFCVENFLWERPFTTLMLIVCMRFHKINFRSCD